MFSTLLSRLICSSNADSDPAKACCMLSNVYSFRLTMLKSNPSIAFTWHGRVGLGFSNVNIYNVYIWT